LLSGRLNLRRSPEVKFQFDQSVAAQDRVEQILYELKEEETARAAGHAPGDDSADSGLLPDTPAEHRNSKPE
jgi:hypothetical protein